jgi:outer membrane murein-binding lipoprotein Lpp
MSGTYSLYQIQIDKLNRRIDQLDEDMKAIAVAIKRNNETTQAILDAIEPKKETPIIGTAI